MTVAAAPVTPDEESEPEVDMVVEAETVVVTPLKFPLEVPVAVAPEPNTCEL